MPISGRINRAVSLVTRVRKAILNKEPILKEKNDGKDLDHLFLYDGKESLTEEWFEYCVKRGLKDAKIIVPNMKDDYQNKAFNNGESLVIVLMHEDKYELMKVDSTLENDRWRYRFIKTDEVKPFEIKMEPKLEEFKKVLADIGDFSVEIKCSGWKKDFMEASDIIDGSIDIDEKKYKWLVNMYDYLPDKFRRILVGSSAADVFGGMGSWNDSPAWCAGETPELYGRYQDISAELSYYIYYHYMYVANEAFID